MEEPEPFPQVLTPCGSGRRRSGDSNSPEFEFWVVRNPSVPQPNILSADELFSGGVVLPLHRLHLSDEPPPRSQQDREASQSDRVPEPESLTNELPDLSASSSLTSSKRWRDIFKKNDKKSLQAGSDDRSATAKGKDRSVKEKKREKKNVGVGASNGASAAELNINIWPFSRSRSAGNSGARPRSAAATRKVSSAPCSRSNSAGESKSRKWPSSPGRAGVHLGRSSPVWHVRRSIGSGGGRSSEALVKSADKGVKKDGNDSSRKTPTAASAASSGSKTRVLSLNVPMCIGYRNHLSCRSDENSAGSIAAAAAGDCRNGGGVSGEGVRGSNLFNIRSLFTKRVY